MKLEFSDGTYKVEDKASDTFFVGFNNYLFLRESCYQCKYCGTDRISDFTLADFWGVDSHEVPPKQMHLGVSVMCANTDMAKKMLPELSNSLYIEKIDSQKAIPYNLAFSQPGDRPKIRDSIFKRLENQNFDSVVKHACWKYYLKLDVKQTIKKWLTTFYRRFFTQQFKRSCIPDGPKVGSVALSPRGDLRMPSDANVELWLKECECL